ncbi:MAG: hypothetical protein JWN03_4443 [Nocardia sp.]|nr:hypothetical protein [Nocardia sp.]
MTHQWPAGPLSNFADAGGAEIVQAGDELLEAAGLAVHVDVQAVLGGFGFGHVLEEQPPAVAYAAGLIERVLGMADCGITAEGFAALVLGNGCVGGGGRRPVAGR